MKDYKSMEMKTTLRRWGQSAVICFGLTTTIYAQTPVYSDATPPVPAILEHADDLFRQSQWNDCLDRLQELSAFPLNPSQTEQHDYMKAVASMHKDLPGCEILLKKYIQDYPTSPYTAEVQIEFGSYLLFHGDAQGALIEFDKVNTAEISIPRQHLLFFRKGQALIETGQYEKARPYYIALEKADDPEFSTEASYYVAYLDYEQENYTAALLRFRQLPGFKKYNNSVPYYIVQILYRQEKWDETLSQALLLLSNPHITPEQTNELNRLVGECYLKKQRRGDALRYLTAYVENAQPAVASSAYNCGVLAAEKGNTALAIKALSKATEAGDNTGNDGIAQQAYMLLGQTYLSIGETHNARLAFERAASYNSNPQIQEAAAYNYAVMIHETACSPFNEEVTMFENFLNQYPHSRYADKASEYLVEVYMTTRNYEAALASIAKIKNPSLKVRTARQRLLYQLGVQSFVNGNIAAATDYFNQCIAAGNLNQDVLGNAYYWRGESHYANGEYAKAESDFIRFNTLKPSAEAAHLASGYYNLGYSYFKQGKFTQAIDAFSQYVAKPSERNTDPYIDALARLGDCYYYNRDFQQAEYYYGTSANNNEKPSADYALFQKAFMAGLQKKYTAKLDDLDLLIRNYPESEYLDDAYLEKGKTYLLLENNEYAIKAFQEVVTHFYNKQCAPQAGLQLALVYYNTGRTNEAINAYKEVIQTHPGSEEAQTALEDLKNIYIERNDVSTYAAYLQTLGGRVPMSAGEQDSLTYVAATRLLANHKDAEGKQALEQYLVQYPSGKYAVEANISLARAARNAGQVTDALKYYDAVTNVPGGTYENEALLAVAEIYQEQGEKAKAFDAYQQLVVRTDNADYKRTALMGSTRMASELGRHEDVVLNFTQLNSDANLKPSLRQEGQLLRGKALVAMEEKNYAYEDLKAAAADTRSAFGAEAKYRLAQLYYDDNKPTEAEAQVFELINSATPHQYWLARGFILLADIALAKENTFQAKQYLQSLQSNYNSNDEINRMIEERLNQCKE